MQEAARSCSSSNALQPRPALRAVRWTGLDAAGDTWERLTLSPPSSRRPAAPPPHGAASTPDNKTRTRAAPAPPRPRSTAPPPRPPRPRRPPAGPTRCPAQPEGGERGGGERRDVGGPAGRCRGGCETGARAAPLTDRKTIQAGRRRSQIGRRIRLGDAQSRRRTRCRHDKQLKPWASRPPRRQRQAGQHRGSLAATKSRRLAGREPAACELRIGRRGPRAGGL